MDSSRVGHHSTQHTASSSNLNDSDFESHNEEGDENYDEDVNKEEDDDNDQENVTTNDVVGRTLIQLIDKGGYFRDGELDNLIEKMNLAQYGTSYMIVAIIGPQSSGKSTLLNHLFGTHFVEMRAQMGRSQTTNGIWLGYNDAIKPCTLAMDIEGSDGEERGENGTLFERQTALFALAVADVVLINIWCNDIGREKAANKTLYKIVFRVTKKLFKPRKITLIFVIRDKSETPIKILKRQLLKTIHEIWNSIDKRADFTQFFNVEVVALPHYYHLKKDFITQVSKLKDNICDPNASHSLARYNRDVVPASVLTQSLQEIWRGIQANKEINIPSHALALASLKCDEILNDKLKALLQSENWNELKKTVEQKSVDALGRVLTSMIHDCLSKYDEATTHFDDNVKTVKRQELQEQLLQHAKEHYTSSMGHARSKIWREFKEALGIKIKNDGEGFVQTACELSKAALQEFDRIAAGATPEQAIWNSSALKNQLKYEMDDHIVGLINSKLPEILNEYKEIMKKKLVGKVKDLLINGECDAWEQIRELLNECSTVTVGDYRKALTRLEVSENMLKVNVSLLRNYAKEEVKETARVESERVLSHMVERFVSIFSDGRDLGTLSKQARIQLAQQGRTECFNVLSTLAITRLDTHCSDTVNEILYRNLIQSSSAEELSLNSSWDGVEAENILLTPPKCLEIWKDFLHKTSFLMRKELSWRKIFEDIADIVSQALAPILRIFK